jgi:hypothetical protein
MSRRKYRSPPPARSEALPQPIEIIEAHGNSGRPPAPAATPLPGNPAPEILEAWPVPRFQLRVVLTVAPGCDAPRTALGAARFTSALHAADRKLQLAVDPTRSCAGDGQLTLMFTPARLGAETAGRLERMVEVVRQVATEFEGFTLTQVEVVPQPE